MARLPKSFLKATEDIYIKKNKVIKLGGVVPLKSYWASTGQDYWKIIDGRFAKVEARETDEGGYYLVIILPFKDGTTKELRVWSHTHLDEGDEVDIASIVMLFIDNSRGNTDIFYDALYVENKRFCKEAEIKKFIIEVCSDLMCYIKPLNPRIEKKHTGSLCDLYDEEQYGGYTEEDNWYAMTDGMYGDYPEEGFDGDYESLGY